MTNLVNVPGIEKTNEAFRQKVIEIADRLLIDPNFLMAIMSFESASTFSPSIRNPVSGATGLIQFMASTARQLGTTTAALAAMTALKQLDFVEEYFKPYKGKLRTIEDAYMAVLFPRGIGKGRDFVLFRAGTVQYRQNRPLDLNADGEITVGEAAKKVAERLGTASVGNTVELKRGDKGPAVEALQDEMIDLGYMTPAEKSTGIGIFGPKTESALKAFQRDIGLNDSGVQDTPTQVALRQLNDGVKKGSSGGIVKILQARLVSGGFMKQADMNTGIGIFGPKTQAALIQFQIKNTLEPNGILTDETYRLLFKSPAPNVTIPTGVSNGIDAVLPISGDGFQTYTREPHGADQFGTQMTINAIIALGRAWFLLHPEIPIQIGDISRRGGGAFPPHVSHRKGKDFDVRPLRKDNRMDPVTIGDANYDTMRTEEIIRLFRSRHPNVTIFFNDQRLINKGLTTHAEGHHNHFHVRLP